MNEQDELNKLIQITRSHPIQSVAHESAKSKIENILAKEDKYQPHLVCVASPAISNVEVRAEAKVNHPSGQIFLQDYTPTGVIPFITGEHFTKYEQDGTVTLRQHTEPTGLSTTRSFTADSGIAFVPRFAAEYDLKYRQLVVVVYVTDGENVVLLETNGNNRIAHRLTLIQGHVEFSDTIYSMSELEYLRLSANRELSEEILISDKKIVDALLLPQLPRFVVNRRLSFADLEHVGVVYEVKVGSVFDLVQNASSGEPDKHQVVAAPLKDIELFKSRLDDWAYAILMSINGESQNPDEKELVASGDQYTVEFY